MAQAVEWCPEIVDLCSVWFGCLTAFLSTFKSRPACSVWPADWPRDSLFVVPDLSNHDDDEITVMAMKCVAHVYGLRSLWIIVIQPVQAPQFALGSFKIGADVVARVLLRSRLQFVDPVLEWSGIVDFL
jgi:hypothetical protein